ncbi:hypothetical protein [Halorussus lipolyticus]|uniref:hypothetical protein n=1 Tax=Halorussus lipolyticus TaxID=3034024 RepID=UPI0023E7793A|nr:hypothetical protein [Halorussus sp. DT80]
MELRLGAIGLGGLGSIELGIYDEMDDVEIVAGTDVSDGAREADSPDPPRGVFGILTIFRDMTKSVSISEGQSL